MRFLGVLYVSAFFLRTEKESKLSSHRRLIDDVLNEEVKVYLFKMLR